MVRLRLAAAFLLAAPLLAPPPARAGDPRLIPDDRHGPTVEERYEPEQFRDVLPPSIRRVTPLLAGPAGEIGSAGLPGNQSRLRPPPRV